MKKLLLLLLLPIICNAQYTPTRHNLIHQQGFENVATAHLDTPFNHLEQVNTGVNLTISTDYANTGTHSCKVIVNKADGEAFSGYRVECVYATDSTNIIEQWIGAAYLIPTATGSDLEPDILWQSHDYPNAGVSSTRSPSIALILLKDSLYVQALSDPSATATSGSIYTASKCVAVIHNQWMKVVVHYKKTVDNTSYFEFWVNNVKIDRVFGAIGYNNTTPDYIKFGGYVFRWKITPNYSLYTTRIWYIDDFRVGNRFATYSDVAP